MLATDYRDQSVRRMRKRDECANVMRSIMDTKKFVYVSVDLTGENAKMLRSIVISSVLWIARTKFSHCIPWPYVEQLISKNTEPSAMFSTFMEAPYIWYSLLRFVITIWNHFSVRTDRIWPCHIVRQWNVAEVLIWIVNCKHWKMHWRKFAVRDIHVDLYIESRKHIV